MKIFYMMGKSSSGKDTLFNLLKNQLDVNTYVMYTTRPKREGEIDGITYNFLTQEEMKKYIDNKMPEKLIEQRTYNTAHGPWTYATIADKQFESDKDMLMMGTLESYIEMKKYYEDKLVPLYIEVEDGLRLERALQRERKQQEPKYVEMCRRFIADSKDFSEENIQKAKITKKFRNIVLEDCLNEIIEYIK